MSVEFFACKGIKVEIENLSIEKAHDFACSLLVAKYVNFLECRSVNDKVESVVFEVEVELGQKVFNDIRQFERLVAHFLNPDNATPEVLTLRKDFPLVPHINLRISEFPRSLCLYDKSYDEIKLDWTPLSFLERIREWLALTAKGELHALDQPLEPILLSYEAEGEIILPDDFDTEDSDTFLAVIPRDIINKRYTFIAQKVPIDKNVEEFQFVAHSVTSLPQKHGIIMKT